MEKKCDNCKHYLRPITRKEGECRRHAPIIVVGLGTKWPRVSGNEWCGDWEERND